MEKCPHCGEEFKKNSTACPHCGSDEQTGWSENTYLSGIDLGDDVDYDDLVNKEFPDHAPRRTTIKWTTIAGAIVLVCFIAAMLKILW
jgi:uncharacterized membrane protein YvbJ